MGNDKYNFLYRSMKPHKVVFSQPRYSIDNKPLW